MFDIAWSELMLIGGVALVVIGPKDLPKAMRTVGQVVGKVRRMAGEFQSQFNDAMREAELHELKKQVEDVGGSVSSSMSTDAKKPDDKPADPLSDYKPIEMPKDEFGAKPDETTSTALSAGQPAEADTLREAEAKLAALPPPEPLPPVEIGSGEVASKPKRVRKPKAEDGADLVAAAAPPVETTPSEAEPAPKTRRSRVARADMTSEAPAAEDASAEKPMRRRKKTDAETGEGNPV